MNTYNIATDIPKALVTALLEYRYGGIPAPKLNEMFAYLEKQLQSSLKPKTAISTASMQLISDIPQRFFDTINRYNWSTITASELSAIVAGARLYFLSMGIPKR